MNRAHFGCMALSVALSMIGTACASAPAEPEGSQSSRLDTGGLAARVSGTGGLGLFVRAAPNTSSAKLGTLAEGASVTIGCQISGETVDGNDVWDYIADAGGYVSDAFVLTGQDGFVSGVKRCAGDEVGGAGGAPSPAPASSSLVDAALSEARSHLGYVEEAGGCNMFSSAMGRPCEAWCSDFVDYVWSRAGFNVGDIGGYSGTIYDYGLAHGTAKEPSSPSVQAGDAVLWGEVGGYSAHVGMVTEVHADGSLSVIHGNFGVGPGGAGMVYEGTIARSDTVGTGYGIYAFVSPVAR